MADPIAEKPPQKVSTIGIMHLVGGVLNIIMALIWGVYGLLTGLMTFGIGLLFCCPAFLLLPVGIVELISGAKHMSKDHTGLKPPKMVGFAEIASILGCNVLPCIFGILTLVFLNDDEVEAYYNSKQLGG